MYSGYAPIEKQGWSATQIVSGVAVLAAAAGVVGLLSTSAAPTSLYAPAMTATKPVVAGMTAPVNMAGARFARSGAQTIAQASTEQFEYETAQPTFSFAAPQQQSGVPAFLMVPVAAVAAFCGFFFGQKKTVAPNPLDVEQGDEWAMAASAADLRSRIQSVKNSKKITDAMKLVASAKLRRAQEAVVQSRPFAESLQGVFGDVVRRLEGTDVAEGPLFAEREVKNITLVIIAGDRGLCGAYNNFVIKRAAARWDELKAAGYNVNAITIGKKVNTWFGKRPQYPLIASYECNTCVAKVPSIVEDLVAKYTNAETDTVELLYTNFVSLVKSNAATRSLLPFKPTAATQEVDEVCRLTTKDGKLAIECEPGEEPENLVEPTVIFEQAPEEILDSMIPLYLNSQLVRTLQESIACELSARMTSMQNASDNAKTLGKELNLKYNRIRQAAVTASILEIAGGATATA
uniref:F-ATPase gamma subunit n=2 Tax=Eutreptiella gymnastica TaxID=73025 RepID=A0A7S1HU73_9EUGL|mmetsp:Transcript_10515/g.18586  ORF Transcript_10515/g.18586 Transcript_10515/m.18586 type:complete len:461 (+) Transcript_10515:100-1482(+)